MKRIFALAMLSVLLLSMFSPFVYADQPSFLEESLNQEENIKTSSWFERQLAGLIAGVANQFFEWMEVWGLKDPYLLIDADNPNSQASNLGVNSATVQEAKNVIYNKFYLSAVVPIAALFIVVIGFQYAMAQNDEGQRKAKEMIIALLTFFVMLFAVNIIFNFLVDVELASVNLIKGFISKQGETFQAILLGATPTESMSAIKSISLAIIALLFVFFMLRMNFIYIVRMISLLVLVALLPISAALSVWPRFRSSLSMLMKEFFAELFMPIGHAVVLLGMYYVAIKNTNAFFMIPFIFAMGAIERIIRSVFGVDAGFGSSYGSGVLSTLGGAISSSRGRVKTYQNQTKNTGQSKEKVSRTDVPAPQPSNAMRNAIYGSGTGLSSGGRTFSERGLNPVSSPETKRDLGIPSERNYITLIPKTSDGVSNVSSRTPDRFKHSKLSTGQKPLSARISSSKQLEQPKRSHIPMSFDRFKAQSIVKSNGSEAIVRSNPNVSLRKPSIASISKSSPPIRARADRIGPMTELDKNTPATKELYSVNQDQDYISVPHVIGRGLQTAARLTANATGKAAKVAAPIIVKKGGAFAFKAANASARFAAGVTAGAVMYGLTGDARAAHMAAYGSSSLVDNAMVSTQKALKTTSNITVRSANTIRDIIKKRQEDRERMQKQMIASKATSRFRNSLSTKT